MEYVEKLLTPSVALFPSSLFWILVNLCCAGVFIFLYIFKFFLDNCDHPMNAFCTPLFLLHGIVLLYFIL